MSCWGYSCDPVADEASSLTRDEVREEARWILVALDSTRIQPRRFEKNWRKLWQLLREAGAASFVMEDSRGPWVFDHNTDPLSAILIADNFRLPVWPTQDGRSGPELARLLNWAGVPKPTPMSDRRSSDRRDEREQARAAAERRREQAELHRRQSEDGREISETIRGRHEEFRDHDENLRTDAERMRDAQESGRELAERAREMSELMRRQALQTNAALEEVREALGEIKNLAQRQREVLERQEKALATFEGRTRKPGST